MSSSLSTRRGGNLAAAATLCNVNCLLTRLKGVLITPKFDLENVKRSMTTVSYLTDCLWNLGIDTLEARLGLMSKGIRREHKKLHVALRMRAR